MRPKRFETLRQPAMETDTAGRIQPAVEHVAIQPVTELVLDGCGAAGIVPRAGSLEKLLPLHQSLTQLLDVRRVV